LGSTHSDPDNLGPADKNQNSVPFFSPVHEVSNNVCQIPIGQKVGEEKDLEETGCFWPRAVLWRLGDIKKHAQKLLVQS
jgi:hypothetical protein